MEQQIVIGPLTLYKADPFKEQHAEWHELWGVEEKSEFVVRERHGWWNEQNKRSHANVVVIGVPAKSQDEARAVFEERVSHLEADGWVFKFHSIFDPRQGVFVPQRITRAPDALDELRSDLIPACPHDQTLMVYDGTYLCKTDVLHHPRRFERYLPSYRCNAMACPVRFRHTLGYFTLQGSFQDPSTTPLPGVNIAKCPDHGCWLYVRARTGNDDDVFWCCAVSGCKHIQAGGPGFVFPYLPGGNPDQTAGGTP